MPLVTSALAASLQSDWLVDTGGDHPASVAASADRLAGVISQWFSAATSFTLPCTTAAARRSSLTPMLIGALSAQDPMLAGNQTAAAVGVYLTGQAFGPGISTPPAGIGASGAMLGAAFSDLSAPVGARAQQLAAGIHVLALTTLVVFPFFIPPQPVI